MGNFQPRKIIDAYFNKDTQNDALNLLMDFIDQPTLVKWFIISYCANEQWEVEKRVGKENAEILYAYMWAH